MIFNIFQEMRIKQWSKNILVFAALVFGGELLNKEYFLQVLLACISFCLTSSGVYFFNDIFDIEKDRLNPEKCNRPIASGKINIFCAYLYAVLLFATGIFLAWQINRNSCLLIILYIVVNILYTLYLKHFVIIDVMIISFGFVLRAVMGAFAIEKQMTPWFLLCVVFLSLFLGLAKRRHELLSVEQMKVTSGRKVLQFYTVDLIDQLISITISLLLICYSLFTIDSNTRNSQLMIFTIPMVLYGVFYYLFLIHVKHRGGAPDEALYKEKPILLVVLLYSVFIIYVRNF